jgi:transcription antitermination factor NusG
VKRGENTQFDLSCCLVLIYCLYLGCNNKTIEVMKVGELVKEINKSILTVEELRILNQLIVRHIKANKKVEALKNSALLKEGDVVRVMHDKLAGLTGKIVQVKRTKAIVKITSTGNQYNVPMELIRSL